MNPLSPNHYRSRLASMVEELRAHPAISVQRVYLSPPTEPYELADAVHQLAGAMPKGMVQMYEELGDFELAWAYMGKPDEDGEQLSGSVRILPVFDMMKDWENTLWFDFMEEENPARILRPFDFFRSDTCAGLMPRGPGEVAQICFHAQGEDIWPTGLTFDDWFERLLQSRGMLYWLEACTAYGEESYEAQRLRRVGPSLFEDFNPELFAPQTDAPALIV